MATGVKRMIRVAIVLGTIAAVAASASAAFIILVAFSTGTAIVPVKIDVSVLDRETKTPVANCVLSTGAQRDHRLPFAVDNVDYGWTDAEPSDASGRVHLKTSYSYTASPLWPFQEEQQPKFRLYLGEPAFEDVEVEVWNITLRFKESWLSKREVAPGIGVERSMATHLDGFRHLPTEPPDRLIRASVRFETDDKSRKVYRIPLSVLLDKKQIAQCQAADFFNSGLIAQTTDLGRAAALFEKACDAGNAPGCAVLGQLYEEGGGVRKDGARAAAAYLKACDGGKVMGCRNLRLMYQEGRWVPKDVPRAVGLLYGKACEATTSSSIRDVDGCRQACDLGDGGACGTLGYWYQYGSGEVGKDQAQAVALLKKACDKADPLGCRGLGEMYARGHGVAKDEPRAATLYKKACDQRELVACYNLGWMYQEGTGVVKDPERAVALFKQACDGGYREGCNGLARIYKGGHGVAKDEPQAAALYKKNCDEGDAVACFYLGQMYQEGTGVVKDQKRAEALFEQACNTGYPEGCNSLARLRR